MNSLDVYCVYFARPWIRTSTIIPRLLVLQVVLWMMSPLHGQQPARFEWEAGTMPGISSAYQAVFFTSAFSEYPIVVVTAQGASLTTEQVYIRNVTKTSFEVAFNGGGTVPVNYFACNPGIWLVTVNNQPQVLIHAGVASAYLHTYSEVTFSQPYPRTPGVFLTGCANANIDPQASGVVHGLQTLPSNASSDLEAGTRGVLVSTNSGSCAAIHYVVINSTDNAHNAGSFQSTGSALLKPGRRFESGFFRLPGPPQSGTVAFSAGFAGSPVVLLTGVSVDALANNQAFAHLGSTPAPTSFSWRLNDWPLGVMWMAMDPGHYSTGALRVP